MDSRIEQFAGILVALGGSNSIIEIELKAIALNLKEVSYNVNTIALDPGCTQGCCLISPREDEAIYTKSTRELICPQTTDENVISSRTYQRIVTLTSNQDIIGFLSLKAIIAPCSIYRRASACSLDPIIVCCANDESVLSEFPYNPLAALITDANIANLVGVFVATAVAPVNAKNAVLGSFPLTLATLNCRIIVSFLSAKSPSLFTSI